MSTPTHTHTAVQLLPCPFCGGTPVAYGRTCNRDTPYNPAHRAYPVVRCDCGAEMVGSDWQHPITAIAKWNRRASLPAVQGEQPSDEQIIRAAVAAMPHTNPGVADDLIQGFTMHTEAEDIVAIWRAAQGAGQDSRPSSVAPGGLPLAQPNSQDGFGDSVSAPVEPPGATLSPCAASQWISVSERLPPLNTEVLIAFDTSPLPATGQLTMCRGIRQWCWPAENDPVGDESLRAVTHWAFMRHPSEIGEWAQVGESSSERGAA